VLKVSDKKLEVKYVLSLDVEEKKNHRLEFVCDININLSTQSIEPNPPTIESVADGLQKNNKAKEINAIIEFQNNSKKLILFKVENGNISCDLEKSKEDVKDVENADFSGYITRILSAFVENDDQFFNIKSDILYAAFNIDWLQIHRFSEKDDEFSNITSINKGEGSIFKFNKFNEKANLVSYPGDMLPEIAVFVLLRFFKEWNLSPESILENKSVFEDNYKSFFFDIGFKKILSSLNAKNIELGFNKIKKEANSNNQNITDYEFSGITGEIEFNSGSTFDWKWLTFGQRRFLIQSILFEAKKNCPLVIDEISNGYHPKLLMELLRLIENYQSFISSHNCMVLDAMPFISSEELIRGIYIIKRDDNGKQTIKKFSEIQAKDIFEKAEVGIMNISQILEAENIW